MYDPAGLLARFGPLATLTLWLGSINIMVGAFNLLPAFPLDGGRILRAILWTITGSLRRATRWAAAVGQTIAWLMIFAGISSMFGLRIPLIAGGFVNGLWLAFLGWFLSNAATLSYRRVIVRDILEGVPVQRLMRSDPPTVSPDIIVRELVDEHVIGRDDQAFPVVSNGALVGMVSIQDIRTVPRDRWQEIAVGEIMTPFEKLATVGPDVDSADAFDRLTQRDVPQLPVLDGTGLVGLVRRSDILRWLQIESREVYLSGSGA